jgi:hypothetical protein
MPESFFSNLLENIRLGEISDMKSGVLGEIT